MALLTLCSVKAQGEMEVDWTAYAHGEVRPTFVHSIDLGYDYAGEYTVAVEYPELVALTAREVQRFGLPKKAGLPEWPEIRQHKAISAKRGQLDISFVPIVWRDGRYWRIKTFTLKVYPSSSAPQRGRMRSAERYASHSVLSAGQWVKVRVAEGGMHMITHEQLENMGFGNPGKVRLFGYGGHLLSETDQDAWNDDLHEVGVWRGDDRLLFYANGSVMWRMEDDNTFTHSRNPYSDYGYYFLTDSEVSDGDGYDVGEAMTARTPFLQTGGTPLAWTPAYTLHEVDDYAWYHGGRKLVESYDYSKGNVKDYLLDASNVLPQSKATLDVCFTHNGTVTTAVEVAMGNVGAGTLTMSKVGSHEEASESTGSFEIDLDEAKVQHAVTLVHQRGTGVSGRLDYLRLNYLKVIGLDVPIYAPYESTTGCSFEVRGADEHTVVWRVNDATRPVRIASKVAGSRLQFADNAKRGDEYIAFDPRAAYPIPEVVGTVANQDLHATPSTDYVIIVPASGKLTAQAKRLAQLHSTLRGLTVKVVRADEVYNEFSSGTPDATAYRRYLKMLYDRASSADEAPKYLLLFGDGAWDNRMLSSTWQGQSPDDYLLCYGVSNSYNAVSSHVVEDYFALLDDGEGGSLSLDKVDVGVGRFPVTTASQARDVVDKIEAYMKNAHAGAWKNTILMLGDDGDKNCHMEDAETVAQMIEDEYPDYMVKRIYWDAFPMERGATGNSYPAVRKRLLELFKEGALMVNYSGHGAPDVLSHELVLNRADMAQIRSPRLPLWVTGSCDITPFDGMTVSFGEAAFLNPNGGAIGLLTSTRTTYAEQNRRINYFFSKYLLARDENNRRLSLGDALRLAKCNLITAEDHLLNDVTGNKLNYVLIGDPALVVGNADFRMVVDEINGASVAGDNEMLLKAGSQVLIKGHVDVSEGVPAQDFSGTLYVSVFDNMEEVVCRNNAGAKDLEPFVYHEHTKKLFVGSDSVKGGEFSFTFRVPMDINYSRENGLINLYAVDSSCAHEATGSFEGFLLGGTEENLNNDGAGPKIQVYLNSTDFVSGNQVNETPRLVAVLEDSDGINTAGSLGHNLIAVIDGKASMTYNLNDYYKSDMGDYTRGSVSYLLPELPEGKHTLMLRAWDMMNNSSTITIEFEVVKGLSPNLIQVLASPSPAHDEVTFMLTHDRPESEMEVTFEVFDFSGRVLWNHSEQVVTLDNNYSYTWNLRTLSGQSLESGVYLYRVIVSSLTGQSASRAQKIIIKR